MYIDKKNNSKLLFILSICLISQSIIAELSFTKIKHLHTVVHPKFDYLSALVGFSWWRTHTIENMYRYGNDQDANIQLLKELFHLQVDDVTFDVTALSKKPAKYFNATIIGTIVGMLELYKDETTENFQAKLGDFKTVLLKEIKKHFSAEGIAAEAKKDTDKLEKKKKALQKQISDILQELKSGETYKNLEQEIKELSKAVKNKEQQLIPFRDKIKISAPQELSAKELKNILKNLDVTALVQKGLILPEEEEQITAIKDEIVQNNADIKSKRSQMAALEQVSAQDIEAKKKEIKAIEPLLHKEKVDVKKLDADLEKLISLIAQAHIESLENKYIPRMPQIILLAFLWKKANAKDKSEFKEYYNQVAQIAHITLVNEYPSDWDSEYTFKEYENLKKEIEDTVKNNPESLLTGQGYEQLTFAFAGYQFWDQPFPAFITSITTTYDFKGVKYDFSNCVEASILNFIIAMLANDTKTAIDLDLLNNIIAKQKDVVINQKMLNFLTTHQSLAPMQTRRNQDAWNQVVQSLASVVYWQPITETPENRFYEIEPGVRNILKVFNHLFFGSSSDFDALSVNQKLTELCAIFNRPGFTVTWKYKEADINTLDVSKTQYPGVNQIGKLTIDFKVKKVKKATFQWNLEQGHSFIPPVGAEQRLPAEKTIALQLRNKLHEHSTALLSLFSWVAGSLPLKDILTNELSLACSVVFMQNLASNEQKLEVITNLLSAFQDPTIIPLIQKLIAKLPEINARNNDGETLLNLAIKFDNKSVVNLLIEHGADVNAKDRSGDTPLHEATKARNGNIDIVQLLLNHGANINIQDSHQNTPLHYAARSGNTDTVRLLLDKGANINGQNSRQDTPLHEAVSSGNTDIVQLLLNNGADVNAQNSYMFTPLHQAASHGKDMVQLLLDKGANINAQDASKNTPLHRAVMFRDKNMITLLLDRGADVNIKDKNGKTPKDTAQQQGVDIVTIFQKAEKLREEKFLRASKDGDINFIRQAIENGADVNNIKDRKNSTPLHYAAKKGYKDIVELLINKGANINAQDYTGYTPLGEAITFRHNNIIALLLDHGANVNIKNKYSGTPLHSAVTNNDKNYVELLLKHGADIHIKNEDGKTPKGIAQEKGFTDIVKILQEKEDELKK